MSDIAIKVENLSKKYFIGAKSNGSLRETLVQKWNDLSSKNNSTKEEFWALKDLSFEVKQGEVLGIIGKNGAGKSTLLKILSRITDPTSGNFVIKGRVSSLLEVGTGFHPELTGLENIYLNGTILGMTRKEIKKKLDEIVDFSGVEKFINTPVKHYSSGMYVRLAFAVAAHLEPEVLIIDEVLAVGDVEFQKKCLGKMDQVAKSGRTILFVSHNMSALNALCENGLFLNNSSVQYQGKIQESIIQYVNHNSSAFSQVTNLDAHRRERGLKQISFTEMTFNSDAYFPNSPFSVNLKLKKEPHFIPVNLNISFHITDQFDNQVYHLSNLFLQKENVEFLENATYCFKIPQLRLKPGRYNIWIWLQSNGEEQDLINSNISFEVQEGNMYGFQNSAIITGIIQPDYEFLIMP